jgi:DNA polymerase-3 subunit delta'
MPELSEIVGQDEAVARLQRAMAGSRMPHAYLFVGPDGVGRRTTAVALAKTLLCEKGKRGTDPLSAPAPGQPGGQRTDGEKGVCPLFSCGTCPDCRMVDAGSHPDFHLVYKELARYHEEKRIRDSVMQDLGIDVIRSFLIAPAYRSGSRGRGKVFVVLEAELMSRDAQNALLKTLEEPPPLTTIILIAERAEEMLPTTLSRCSIVRFGPLPRDFVVGRLVEKNIAKQEAQFWAAFTDGSLGRALELADRGMYPVKCDMIQRLAELGPAGAADLGAHLAKVMEKLADQEVAAVQQAEGAALSKTLASRKAAAAMLQLIAGAVHDALALKSGAAMPVVHADQPDAIQALARRFEPAQLAQIIEQLSEYEELLWRNVNPKIVWDNVVITCASAAPLGI